MKNNIVNWKYERDRGFIFYLIGLGCQKVRSEIYAGILHKKVHAVGFVEWIF